MRRWRWRCSSLAKERLQYSQDSDFRWEEDDFFLARGVVISSSMVGEGINRAGLRGNWRKSRDEQNSGAGKEKTLWGWAGVVTCTQHPL